MFSMFKQCSDYVNCMFITPEHAEHAINCKMAIFFMMVFSYSFACSSMFSMFSMFRSCSNHVQTKYCACSDMYYTLFKPEHTQYMLNMLEHAKHALNPAKHAEHAAPPRPYLLKGRVGGRAACLTQFLSFLAHVHRMFTVFFLFKHRACSKACSKMAKK